jgi:deoxyribose-phosphate aldolase
MTDLLAAARIALAALDLTSLNDGDTEASTAALCQRAQTPFGPVAAVCVWPKFVRQARASLPASIRVAAVANFPAGTQPTAQVLDEVHAIAQAGAQEIDVVLPWRALAQGQVAEVAEFVAEVRQASQPLVLKVILETGELKDQALVRRASQLCLGVGVDFLKTSTGKTPTSATLEAAHWMLDEIRSSALASAGFKASGGIRSVAQAVPYIELVRGLLGHEAPSKRLRFGASGLLDDIVAVLSGAGSLSQAGAY